MSRVYLGGVSSDGGQRGKGRGGGREKDGVISEWGRGHRRRRRSSHFDGIQSESIPKKTRVLGKRLKTVATLVNVWSFTDLFLSSPEKG